MKKFLFDCGTRDGTASFSILVMRVMIGLMMLIGHGIGKIQKFEVLKQSFYVPDFFPFSYLSPQASLCISIGAEIGAALLLILGLATRPAAFILGFNMVIAAFAYHAEAVWFTGHGISVAKEPAILYLIPLIGIILSGSGVVSLDALIYKERKSRLKMSI